MGASKYWLGGVLAGAFMAVASCSPAGSFTCQSNDQCGDGMCEPSGFCSFPDGTCDSGRRYGQFAGSLGGACVDVIPSGSTGDSMGSSATDPSTSTTVDGSTGVPAECGNGAVEGGEDCDDGNLINSDGCNADCVESGALLWSLVHVTPSTAISLYRDVTVVDGEPVVVGLVSDQVEDDNGLMLRYDAQGELVWSQTLDGEGLDDRLDGVAFDGQQLLATGRSEVDDANAGVQGFVWLVSASPGGGVPTKLTGPQGRGISIVPSPGGVLIAGALDPDGVPWAGEFTIDGVENFSATDGTTDVGQFAAVVIDPQGGMFAAGFRETADGKDFILEEITDTGLLSLSTLSGSFGSAEGQALTVTDAGDLWAGGYVQAGADNAHRNWLTRRYRSTGDIVSEDEWTQPGSMLSDEVQAITVDAVGDVIAAGFTNVGGNTMMMVRRYSPTGSIRWTQTYDYGADKDVIRGIAPDDEGGLYVVGEVTEDTGQQVGWLGRLGP